MRTPPKVLEEKFALAHSLYEAGTPIREIAQQVNRSVSTVRRWLQFDSVEELRAEMRRWNELGKMKRMMTDNTDGVEYQVRVSTNPLEDEIINSLRSVLAFLEEIATNTRRLVEIEEEKQRRRRERAEMKKRWWEFVNRQKEKISPQERGVIS